MPCAQKYSATVVAASAARMRSKGRLVGGGDDDHGALAAFLSERVFEEVAHFAAAFADQPEHGEVGSGVARHHADQRALAHAAAAENADALSAAAGEESIDRADAAAERFANRQALQGQRGGAVERPVLAGAVGAERIERLPAAVENAPQHFRGSPAARHARPRSRPGRHGALRAADRAAWPARWSRESRQSLPAAPAPERRECGRPRPPNKMGPPTRPAARPPA